MTSADLEFGVTKIKRGKVVAAPAPSSFMTEPVAEKKKPRPKGVMVSCPCQRCVCRIRTESEGDCFFCRGNIHSRHNDKLCRAIGCTSHY